MWRMENGVAWGELMAPRSSRCEGVWAGELVPGVGTVLAVTIASSQACKGFCVNLQMSFCLARLGFEGGEGPKLVSHTGRGSGK